MKNWEEYSASMKIFQEIKLFVLYFPIKLKQVVLSYYTVTDEDGAKFKRGTKDKRNKNVPSPSNGPNAIVSVTVTDPKSVEVYAQDIAGEGKLSFTSEKGINI